MSFSNSLKKLRVSRRMTQAQLASALKMSKSAISMYECGKRKPELDVLAQFADYFGVDLNEMAGQTVEPDKDPELNELLNALRSRSEMRMLFSVTKDATKEDVEKAVRIIEALRSEA